MSPNAVWTGCLLLSAPDPKDVTPAYWLVARNAAAGLPGEMAWCLVTRQDGLAVPYRHAAEAHMQGVLLASGEPRRPVAIVACDCLPPGAESLGATGRTPQVTVCSVLLFNEHHQVDVHPIVPGRDQLALLFNRLYGGEGKAVDLADQEAGDVPW